MQPTILTLILITISFASGFYAAQVGPHEEAEELLKRLRDVEISVQNIFLHNFLITLVTVVPFVGIPYHMFVQYSTGYAFGIITISFGSLITLRMLLTLVSAVFLLE